MRETLRRLKKGIVFILNALCPSCPWRVRLFRLFGGKIHKNAKIEFVNLVQFDGTNLANLEMAEGAYIGPATLLDLSGRIVIGKSVKIAAGCNISTHVNPGEENEMIRRFPKEVKDVVIGDHSWIGLSTTILCGVRIGENTAIGSCSLVNRDIPSDVLAYGVPARVHKEFTANVVKFSSR